LATPPWAEATTFAELSAFGEAWNKAGSLQVPVGFIMGADPTFYNGEDVVRELVWKPKRARNERIMNAGHLVVEEKPDELADAMWRFIGAVMGGRWDEASEGKAKL